MKSYKINTKYNYCS